VGLLPGGGGTQRLPRLIGIESALPILLEGGRLSGEAALKAGLVDALAAPGDEGPDSGALVVAGDVAPANLGSPGLGSALANRGQPPLLPPARQSILATTLGHYPAPLAILDCVEFGLAQCFDGAIRSEMAIFAHLIQRSEARNMIFRRSSWAKPTMNASAERARFRDLSPRSSRRRDRSSTRRILARTRWPRLDSPGPGSLASRPSAKRRCRDIGSPAKTTIRAAPGAGISQAHQRSGRPLEPKSLARGVADRRLRRGSRTGLPRLSGGPFAFGAAQGKPARLIAVKVPSRSVMA